jgi:hypothetical protein
MSPVLEFVTGAVMAASYAMGRRRERDHWRTQLVTPAPSAEEGRAWAAYLLEKELVGRGANDPIVFVHSATNARAFSLHYKRDIGIYVYHPEKGSIVHGKTFEKWATRAYREHVKHYGGDR